MRAHLVQFDMRWEDKPFNRLRTRELLEAARPDPGDLAVLPEMFDTGFSFAFERTADSDGKTLGFLKDLARDLRITVHGARTVLGPDNRGRNRVSVTAPDGSLICEYDKIHPFTLGKEPEHFTGGDTVTTYTWSSGRDDKDGALTVCPAICYDLRFPELFRLGLLKGAEVFALGSSWPAAREFHRHTLSVARAIENEAYVLSVNRCGSDPSLTYAGGSLAVSPKGEILGQLDDREGVLSVEIDPGALRVWRRTFPAWKDHRLIGRTS